MDTSALSFAFSAVFTPINMLVILGGTILGIFIGAMPGMSSPMGLSIMLPFTFQLHGYAGIMMLLGIFCGSIYGHTENACEILASRLAEKGVRHVRIFDVSHTDVSEQVSAAFQCSHLVFASATYNGGIYTPMETLLLELKAHALQNRTVALIENGSWGPAAARLMAKHLEEMKGMEQIAPPITIRSALSAENREQLNELSKELCREYAARDSEMADKHDMSALFRIGYGLYVVTSNDGKKDNGLVVNTVTQLTDHPNRVAVTINKANYSHHVIRQTGILNVNCLSVDAPYSLIETFGFQSGRNADKFAGCTPARADNGLAILPRYINAMLSLRVTDYVDLGSHGMFICSVTEARVMSDAESMTYAYYQKHVKPAPETAGKKGYVCKVCGYVYEGDTLPEDFVCPLCKHGAADFEPIQ